MKKAIITGTTGAIGMALIELLSEKNIHITAVCHRGSKRTKRIPKSDNVQVLECDLDELKTLPDRLEHDYDLFYHFAWAATFGDARNNTGLQVKNIEYTLDAVDVAKALGCKKFIGAGSQAEYGRHEGVLTSKTPAFPENGYGMAKLCAGQMSRLRCAQLGMGHVWARILSVYGPHDGEKTMVMSIIRQLLAGGRPSCTKGEQIWDYLYSKDAAQALYLLGLSGKNGRTYCISSGKGRPLAEYILAIRDAVSPSLEIGFGDVPYAEKQVMHLCADIQDLKADVGFSPEYSFEEGIKETIQWVRHCQTVLEKEMADEKD